MKDVDLGDTMSWNDCILENCMPLVGRLLMEGSSIYPGVIWTGGVRFKKEISSLSTTYKHGRLFASAKST